MAKADTAALWVKLRLPGAGQIGPGKIDLLRRIGEQHSISAAARAMDMSYRRAWLLVDEINKLFDQLVARANEANRELLAELGRRRIARHRPHHAPHRGQIG